MSTAKTNVIYGGDVIYADTSTNKAATRGSSLALRGHPPKWATAYGTALDHDARRHL